MRHSFLSFLLMSVITVWTTKASAQYVYKNMDAYPTYFASMSWSGGETHTFETTNLSTGCDTVIHLFDRTSGVEVAYSDDAPGLGFASKITYTNPTSNGTHSFYLLVRAYAPSTRGTADILRDGAVWVSAAPIGGTRVTVPSGTGYKYETARAPGGTIDTVLFGLNSSRSVVAVDDDGGVGYMSLVQGRSDVASVVVLPYYYRSTTQKTNIYANDPTDNDHDGLGMNLEAALGTCDSTTQSGCSAVFNPVDTDRDGVDDMAEVFGIDTTPYIELPFMGADPRHKDVFVEVDYESIFSSQPFTEAEAVQVQTFFNAGSAGVLKNPDGLSGVHLHFDANVSPSDPANATLIGSWGGGGTSVPTTLCNSFCGTGVHDCYGCAPALTAAATSTYRATNRVGLFRYSLIDGQGGGYTWNEVLRVTLENTMRVYTHELGHAVGLAHSGHAVWGDVNCKPQYASVMNYLYGITTVGFSTASTQVTLNPTAASEVTGIGEPSSFLHNNFFYLVDNSNLNKIDWNRDYEFELAGDPVGANPPSDFVRAALIDNQSDCGALSQNQQMVANNAGATTPVFVRIGTELYLFWVGTDNQVWYSHGTIGGATTGSCPGGDTPGAACMTWSAKVAVSSLTNVAHISALNWSNQSVVLATVDKTSHAVKLRRGTISGTSITGWSSDTVISGATTDREPQLLDMSVIASFYGGNDRILALMYRSYTSNKYEYSYAPSPTGAWTYRGVMKDDVGAALANGDAAPVWPVGPTVIPAPTGEYCGLFTWGGTYQMGMTYCYSASTDRWLSADSTIAGPAKPAMAYHVNRLGTGMPVHGDPAAGSVWVEAMAQDSYPAIYQSNPFNGDLPLAQGINLGSPHSMDYTATRVAAMALYEDSALTALKGAWVMPDGRLQFLPFADGTIRMDMKNGNDFKIMEWGICNIIRGSTYCGTSIDGN